MGGGGGGGELFKDPRGGGAAEGRRTLPNVRPNEAAVAVTLANSHAHKSLFKTFRKKLARGSRGERRAGGGNSRSDVREPGLNRQRKIRVQLRPAARLSEHARWWNG